MLVVLALASYTYIMIIYFRPGLLMIMERLSILVKRD